jgi:hypothetical protein
MFDPERLHPIDHGFLASLRIDRGALNVASRDGGIALSGLEE